MAANENLKIFLQKSLTRNSLRQLCLTAGVPARGNLPVLAGRVASSFQPTELLQRLSIERNLSWDEKLFLRTLTDGPKSKREILDDPCVLPVLQFAQSQDLPSYYQDSFRERFVRANRRHLVRRGIVLLNRRGLTYSINEPFGQYLRPFLQQINPENSLDLYKGSREYASYLRLGSRPTLLTKDRRDEILEVKPPIMINETQAISRVVAFSDYRVQDVDLLIEYLRSLNPPPDLILYAGDDIDRFGPLPEDFLRRRVESAKRLAQGDLRGTDVRDMYLFKVKPIGSGKDRVVKGIARSTWTHCHISRLIRERLNNFESEGTVNVADLKEAVESVFKELGSSGVEFSTGQGSLVMPRTELKSIHLEVNSDLFEGRISAYLGVSSPVKFIVDSDWLRLARRETDPETFTSVDQVLHGLLGKAVVIPSSSNGKESSGILYFPTEHRNLFELLATLTKYGLCGVIGNDDNSHVRDLIVGRKVFNVHNVPVIIGSYAIIGQEAAPIKPDQPNPGIILYDENSIAKHLENFLPHVEGKKLIVVSHAPPLEVLDHALRFGESNIGSQSLREFVENHKNVKMVVSGHVHYCGGKTANLSDALIVNAASHDSYGEPGKVAVIDIDQQGGLAVHWHLIHELPGIFGIGPKISTRLKSSGIRAVEHMLATPLQEICAKTGYSQRTVEKWMIRAKAIVEGRVYPLSRFVPPPPPRIYVDIETDLAQSVIWLVGVYSEARSEYGCFFASSPKEEKGILLDFLEFVKRQPNSTICSFSGSNFDGRVLKQRLEAHKLNSSATGRIVDLYQPILKSVALPLKSYGLKSLGRFFRYDYKHPNIDGFDIAIMYFNQYLKSKDEKLRQIFEEYNRDDVLILPQLIRSLVELTSDPR